MERLVIKLCDIIYPFERLLDFNFANLFLLLYHNTVHMTVTCASYAVFYVGELQYLESTVFNMCMAELLFPFFASSGVETFFFL